MKITADETLTQALFTLARARSGTREAMQQRAVASVDRVWSASLSAASGTTPEQRILADGATSQVGPSSITLVAGNGGSLSGGITDDAWPAFEYGMTPARIVAPNRRKKIRIAGSGREMTVATQVWVGKNLRPRNPDGYVVFPTIRQHGPQFVAAWIYGLIGVFDGGPFDVKKG